MYRTVKRKERVHNTPSVWKLWVQKEIQDSNHGSDASPENNIKTFVLALQGQFLSGPQQRCTVTQQIQYLISWGWWGFVHWGTSTAEVLKEHLDCSLGSIGIQCCFNFCFRVPTIFLIRVACYVLRIILLLFSGCRLVSFINISASMTPGDAPVSCVWTPSLRCPTLQVHFPPTLAHFLLPLSQAAPYVPFSWLSPPYVP